MNHYSASYPYIYHHIDMPKFAILRAFLIFIFWAATLFCFLSRMRGIYEFMCTYTIFLCSYWLLSFYYYWTDQKPLSYLDKIQNKSAQEKYTLNFVSSVIFNHTVLLIPLILLYCSFMPSTFSDPFPDYHIMIWKFILNLFLFELQFYAVHYLLHTRLGYHYVHYVHHKYDNPFAMSAQYVHPVEFIFLFIHVVSGPFFLDMHPITICLWIMLVNYSNVSSHSGYELFYDDNTYHDTHHRLAKYNYGSMRWLDCLLGTYKSPIKHTAK
jgi:methylsterol monooxygenase